MKTNPDREYPDELERLLSEAWLIEDDSLVVACNTPQEASAITAELYDRNPDETFHIEHYPCTNDDTGEVEYYALLIRRLHYDHEFGWASADVADSPEIDLRDYETPIETDGVEPGDTDRRFAVCAETVFDPHHNYTILGRIVTRDLSEFDSLGDAARDAVRTAVETMPESIDDIVDDEFKVLVIEDSSWVPVYEFTTDGTEANGDA